MAGKAAWPVLLYVPNLIGYARIGLALVAFWNVPHPATFLTFYTIGFLLDAADGYAARLLGQSSAFGAVLDMLTDRFSTAGLLLLIALQDLANADLTCNTVTCALTTCFRVTVCVALLILDAVSHFWQVCAATLARATSHKAAGPGRLVKLYYRRSVLTTVCLFSEVFLLLHLTRIAGWSARVETASHMELLWIAAYYGCAIVYVLKQFISLAQIWNAAALLELSCSGCGHVSDAKRP
jgi:CDP-diacylglycerol--inositol 3-phosphatidyltransferase